MLTEFDEIDSATLKYVLGGAAERSELADKFAEVECYFAKMRELPDADRAKDAIDALHERYTSYVTRLHSEVFDVFDPQDEAFVVELVEKARVGTGAPLVAQINELRWTAVAADDAQPAAEQYAALERLTADQLKSLLDYTRGNDLARDAFDSGAADIEGILQTLVPLEQGTDRAPALDDVSALLGVIQDAGPSVFERYDPASKARATDALQRIEFDVLSALNWHINLITESARDSATGSLADLRERTYGLRSVLNAGLLGMSSLGGLLLLVTRFHISLPMQRMTTSMRRLAAGDLDVPLESGNRSDEIGDMADALQVFRTNAVARKQMEGELVVARDQAEAAGSRNPSSWPT